MKRTNIITIVLCCAIALTSVFSVSRVNATEINLRDYIMGKVHWYNSSASEYTLYTLAGGDVYDGVGTDVFRSPSYSQSYCIPTNAVQVRARHIHNILDDNNDVTLSANNKYLISVENTYCALNFFDYDNSVNYYGEPTSIYQFYYTLYYTDGSISSNSNLSSSCFDYSSDWQNYDLSFEVTPTKDVKKIVVNIVLTYNVYNQELYNQVQYPGFYFALGCYDSDHPIYISVSDVDDNIGIFSSIRNLLEDLFGQSNKGFGNVLTRLNEVKSGIVSKLGTVGDSITTMKDNLLSRLDTVKSGITDKLDDLLTGLGDKLGTVGDNIVTMKDNLLTRLTEVKSGIVDKLVTVGDSITTMKDNVVSGLTNVKDGIVDKLKSVSDFFSFSDSGQSILDGFNSDSIDSAEKFDSATDEVNNTLSEDVNIDEIMENTFADDVSVYDVSSNFNTVLGSIVSVPIVSRMMLQVATCALLAYLFFGKR